MRGELSRDLWGQLSSISTLTLSNTRLNGSIPDRDPTLPSMLRFLASNAEFSGSLPINIDAAQIDLSNNRFHGPLILFDDRFTAVPQLTSLTLASAGNLSCPIQLSTLVSLATLVLSGDGFDGCDWTNVTLPASLTQLDISSNLWRPFDLMIPPSIIALQASRSGIRGILNTATPLALQELTMDSNPLLAFNSAGVSVFDQLSTLLSGQSMAPNLRAFSCQDCDISVPLTKLMPLLSANTMIEFLRLDNNELEGQFPFPTSFVTLQFSFPVRIASLSFAGNSLIRGALPPADTVLHGLESIDVSNTELTGPLPLSWANFPALSSLNLANTSIQCLLVVTAQDNLQCAAQSVLSASPSIVIASTSLADQDAGVHCSALTIAATGSSSVTADPSYHSYTECRCDANSFGLNALCYRCPEGCTCSEDRIQNCFPVVQRGAISVNPADPSGSRAVIAGSISPFTVTAILPCPRTVTGSSLCNPDGISWPSFYRINEAAQVGSVSDALARRVTSASLADSDSSSPSHSEIDLSDWCYPGHTGRLCAACSTGYFSSGRWCLKCLSEGVHVLILIANLLLICALIAYLYVKSPNAVSSEKPLLEYNAGIQAIAEDRSLSGLTPSPSSSDVAAAEVSSANPLKLLIFHSQQLSLLLQTTASMPNVIAGLMSAVRSGSNGFSLSSLVAMECLNSAWSMQHRCWLAIVAPLLIATFAGLTFLFDRKAAGLRLNRRGRSQFSNAQREGLLMVDEAEAADHVASEPSSAVPRIYGVCVSLLYLLVFPCAQTALSALTCTDTRQNSGGDARVYLNLFPAQQCDAEWSRTVLPPAVIGAVFWLGLFPLLSTLLLRRLRAQLHSSSLSAASSLAVWPICSDLMSPFTPCFWFWEQILLVRRLLLVSAVAIIPASSLYLPLVLFALVQLSALLQHWTNPYAHPLLNAGELISLYLLLINYISALILQTGLTEGGFHQTADAWAVVLFLVNFAFLLILVAGLFGWARKRIAKRWATRTSKGSALA